MASPVLLKRAATVELDWDVRQKSRFAATDCHGPTRLGVFLPRGTVVRGGDVLVAEDGSLIARHRRAAGRCCEITHCAKHGTPFDLDARAPTTWATGTCPSSCKPDHLKIEPDHVLADMLRAMHLIVHRRWTRPSSPRAAPMRSMAAHVHDHDMPMRMTTRP